MSRLQLGQNPRCVDLNHMELWVQIHDLKVGFMSEKVLTGIGNYIGKFISSCPSNFVGVWREYMRIRVLLNLVTPLKRRMKIKITGNEWSWVSFKYENVPSFCFICGIVGHSEKFCGQLFEKTENKIVKPYGAWMRAPFKKQVKPIGAKWLRNGDGSSSFSSQSHSHGWPTEEDDVNLDPKITPVEMVVVIKGGDKGITINQKEDVRAGQHGSFQINATDSPQYLGHNDLIIIETKKCRMGDGLSNTSMGLNQTVHMNSDINSELGSVVKENSPKNVHGASTQVGARQAL